MAKSTPVTEAERMHNQMMRAARRALRAGKTAEAERYLRMSLMHFKAMDYIWGLRCRMPMERLRGRIRIL
jgi:hypothetical protein